MMDGGAGNRVRLTLFATENLLQPFPCRVRVSVGTPGFCPGPLEHMLFVLLCASIIKKRAERIVVEYCGAHDGSSALWSRGKLSRMNSVEPTVCRMIDDRKLIELQTEHRRSAGQRGVPQSCCRVENDSSTVFAPLVFSTIWECSLPPLVLMAYERALVAWGER